MYIQQESGSITAVIQVVDAVPPDNAPELEKPKEIVSPSDKEKLSTPPVTKGLK
jgi:hypothetical protein